MKKKARTEAIRKTVNVDSVFEGVRVLIAHYGAHSAQTIALAALSDLRESATTKANHALLTIAIQAVEQFEPRSDKIHSRRLLNDVGLMCLLCSELIACPVDV